MASLNMFVSPAITTGSTRRRVQTFATAAKSSGGASEEKGFLDFILGALQKKDQLLEVDPILNKVEDKKNGMAASKKISVAPKKNEDGGFGGLGGLFAKK